MARDKIKILFRHRSMEMGGVEKVLLSILNNLSPEKFECTVLLNLNQGELRDEFPPHVKKICIAKGKEDMAANALLQKIALLRRRMVLKKYAAHREKQDAKLLNHEKFDVEIAMDWRDFESVLSSPNRDSKKIGWFHSEINEPKLQVLVPQILQQIPQFDDFVYCSEKIKTLLHQHYPDLKFPREHVIINAVPTEEITKKAGQAVSDFPKTDAPVFIGIGRLHTRKGFHKLAEAHRRVLDQGLKHQIIIIGDGEERSNLKNQIEALGIADTFHLLGARMNPYPYLKRADYFIMPSESEAWPLVLAESVVLNTPAIATDTGDVSTIIENDENGILISYSTEEIAAAMEKVLRNPDLRQKFKNNLISTAEKLDGRKIFEQIETLLLS